MKFRIFFIIVLFLVGSISCNKLDIVPTNQYTELNYWTSYDRANLVLNTAYGQIFNSDYFFYNEALSDNGYNARSDNAGATSISAGIYDASLGRLEDEWKWHYQAIKTSNTLLQYIDNVPNMTEDQKTKMKAEARFLRAWHYFQLSTWWGDVPLFTQVISIAESQKIARTPKNDVLAFVLKELDEIESILPINTSYTGSDIGRVSKGAVIALKARIKLYNSNWQGVVDECSKLINSQNNGSYSLNATYDGIFDPANENNNEVILSFNFVPLLRTYSTMFDLVPLSVGARLNSMAPTQELVNDYVMLNGKTISQSGSNYNENTPYINRDPRMTSTIVYDGYQWKNADGSIKTIYIKPGTDPDKSAPDEYKPGTSSSALGYYLRKYFDPTAVNFNSGLNLILIRYADVLLMYAEAKNELSKMDESTWNSSVRALRARAGFTDPNALQYDPTISQDSLRSIVRRERRSELAFEGLRIFDIRRWKTIETVLNTTVHGARFGDLGVDNGYIRGGVRIFNPSRHYLWPVPRDERALNSNLTQNPGW